MVYDLFIELNANDYQLEFPVVYASGKGGFCKKRTWRWKYGYDSAIWKSILEHVQDPEGDATKSTQFLITNTAYDNYVGKLAVGRIHNGFLKRNQELMLIKRDGKQLKGKVSVLYGYEAKRVEVEEAYAGDIVCVAGINDIDIGETLADVNEPLALPVIDIDEPNFAMTFMVNDSPFVGKDGKFVTSRHIWDRLQRNSNKCQHESRNYRYSWCICCKGKGRTSTFYFAWKYEKRRLLKFKFQNLEYLFKENEFGKKLEPIELALIDVDTLIPE